MDRKTIIIEALKMLEELVPIREAELREEIARLSAQHFILKKRLDEYQAILGERGINYLRTICRCVRCFRAYNPTDEREYHCPCGAIQRVGEKAK